MRIISKFKDYYDGVGYDESTLFLRKEEDFQISDSVKNLLRNVDYFNYVSIKNHKISINLFIIGFCGNIYPGFRVDKPNPNFNFADSSHAAYIRACKDDMYIYTSDDLIQYLESLGLPQKEVDKFNNEYNKFHYRSFSKKSIDEEFEQIRNSKKLKDLFLKYNTPIFTIEHERNSRGKFNCKINSILKDYNFQSIFDPWTAYQEIEMYLNGPLCQSNDISDTISDVHRRDAHGFDDMSFKKLPTKRK